MINNKLSTLKKAIKYYKDHRPFFYIYLRPYELYLFNKVKPNIKKPILDFGCGDGFFSKFNFNPKEIDYGADIDSSLRSDASKFYKKYLLADNNLIPLPKQSISTIISNSVFEHLKDPLVNLNEMSRVLKRGGKIYTTIVLKYWENYLFGNKLFGNKYKRYMRKIQRHNSFFTDLEWERMFKKAGFRIKSKFTYISSQAVEKIDIYHYLSSPSFIAYKLTGKWDTCFNKLINDCFYSLSKDIIISYSSTMSEPPCCFYELIKI